MLPMVLMIKDYMNSKPFIGHPLQEPIAHVCDTRHSPAIIISISKMGMSKPCQKRVDSVPSSSQTMYINTKKMPLQLGERKRITMQSCSSILIPATFYKPLNGSKLHHAAIRGIEKNGSTSFAASSWAKEKKCLKPKTPPYNPRTSSSPPCPSPCPGLPTDAKTSSCHSTLTTASPAGCVASASSSTTSASDGSSGGGKERYAASSSPCWLRDGLRSTPAVARF